MAAFDYRQAEELKRALDKQQVRYLFIGKSAAIILGFPDTTQDADLFIDRSPENGRRLTAALLDLGFELTSRQAEEIERGKDFIQLKNGPFDVDLVFAPDGIETFQEAWDRRVVVEGYPVCHLDHIIASKEAANRRKDREVLPRLRSFRRYWLEKNK
jgi:predicted nucleotidyltransferase